MSSHTRKTLLFLVWLVSFGAAARADEIVLEDGRRDSNCIVRDEGAWVRVWWEPYEFPYGGERFLRERVHSFSYASEPSFDEDLPLPDLCVTHVEILPRKTSYQGLDPEALAAVSARAKLRWEPGEELRFVAHVVNTGRVPATEFVWVCSIDGTEIDRGRVAAGLEVRGERTFEVRWPYVPEARELRFRIESTGDELSRANDARSEELDAWAIACVVHPRWVESFHQKRNVCGTFSIEHHVQWHLDLLNELLGAAPGADGATSCRARVRLDRIVYARSHKNCVPPLDGPEQRRSDQGCLVLGTSFSWETSSTASMLRLTSWSLMHSLVRELGVPAPFETERSLAERAFSSSEILQHTDRVAAMAKDGGGSYEQLFGPSDTIYLDRSRDLPRGLLGERFLATPEETWIRCLDVNGEPLAGAEILIFIRGVDLELSETPENVGTTDATGLLRLPHRAVVERVTPNGFHAQPNPFGALDPGGVRGSLLARVRLEARATEFWISIDELNTHVLRGGGPRCEIAIPTDFGSRSGPPAPRFLRFDPWKRLAWVDLSTTATGESSACRYRLLRRESQRDLREAPWQIDGESHDLGGPVKLPYRSWGLDFGLAAVDEHGRSSEVVPIPAPSLRWIGDFRYDSSTRSFAIQLESESSWFEVVGLRGIRPRAALPELPAEALTPFRNFPEAKESWRRGRQHLSTLRGDQLSFFPYPQGVLHLSSASGELLRSWTAESGVARGLLEESCRLCLLPWGEVAIFDANTGEIVCFDPYAPAASDHPLPLEKDGVFAHEVWYEEPVLQPKVLVLNFDPLVADGAGGEVRLSKYAGWNDPRTLAEEFRRDLHSASGGYVKHRIVEWRDLDVYPRKVDGFAYEDASYLAAKAAGQWHDPDRLDYAKLVEEHGLAALVANGTVDEVWMFGGPAFGFYETQMVGPKAYWCNSPGLDVEEAQRLFVIFGFNYERGVAEMIHDLGHMTESILAHVYEPQVGKWRAEERRSAWERFSAYDAKHPGLGGVGNCHFPVNGEKDYDYANPRAVPSSAADWKLWPLPLEEPRLTPLVSCATWGGPDHHRNYQRWFFSHLPRRPGRAPDGRLANWWEYLFHLNAHEESRGR